MNKPEAWQNALINAINDPEELLQILELDKKLLPEAIRAAEKFPLKVPRSFLARIEKGNPADPLLKQILPLGKELLAIPGYTNDPLKEADVNPIPGLLHKYQSRVLLTLVGTCAINCRYCFRRHFPYEENNPGQKGWAKALEYIAETPTILEVILSGGDPLVVNDTMLTHFVEELANIPHVKRLRVHSRIPIVLPERITTRLIHWATATRLQVVFVTHSNHPNEIDATVNAAMAKLSVEKITLLNQTVLLKGINDAVDTLVQLSEALFSAGILPYYLHLLDKVHGAAHFDSDLEHAKELHWGLAKRLSGYLVPKLVWEKPGAPAKLPIFLE